MKDEIKEIDELLNTLKTSSLEPHEEYTMEFSNREQKLLLDYITNLQAKIDKAIKYIEQCSWSNGIDEEIQYSLHIPTLLNILKENKYEKRTNSTRINKIVF